MNLSLEADMLELDGDGRVEVVAFENVSQSRREEADMFLSGYLIPNLLPIPQQAERSAWESRPRAESLNRRWLWTRWTS